jgi:molecular chaperone GrpE
MAEKKEPAKKTVKPPPPTKADKELKKKEEAIIALSADVEALKESLLREQAEMVNFKRRLTEEKIKDRQFANADIFKSLLPVMDHFDMLLKNEKTKPGFDAFEPALKKLYDQYLSVFQAQGLEKLDALHQPFDPTLHEAVMSEASPEHDPQTVIEVFQPGYIYKERLLRPAMVKVSE